MATFKQFVYSKTSDEIEFLQGLIDLICADGDITCEDAEGNPTTAAAQYADLTSASRAEFYFNFGDGYRFQFSRGNTNNNATNKFYFNGTNNNNWSPYFTRNDTAINTVTARIWFIRLIKSDNLFYLGIGDFSTTSTPRNIVFHYNDTQNEFHGITMMNENLTSMAFSSINDSASLYFPSVLNYAASAGKIDYIDHTPMISGGTKQFDVDEIYSCSTVSQFSSIALPGGKVFYAIGEHALVEIDEDEAS